MQKPRAINPRHLLSALFVVGLLLGIGGAVASVWTDYVRTEQQAVHRAEGAAALVADHANGTFDAVNQLLARATAEIGGRPLSALVNSPTDYERFREIAASLPTIVSLLVVDEEGMIVLGTRRFVREPTDVSDRDYFTAQLAQPGFYIGKTIFGRAARQFVFTVSRPLFKEDGSFAGVVAITLDVGIFENVYRRLDLDSSATLALTRPDGEQIAAFPIGQSVSWLPLAEAAATRQGTSSPGPVSMRSAESLTAWDVSERYPIVGVASLPLSEVFGNWHRRSLWTASVAGIGILGASLLFVLLRQAMARESRLLEEKEAAYEDLSRSNALLNEMLAFRAVLVREVHHRVKNNLQIVSALLSIQLGASPHPEVREALKATQARLSSMARLHQVLYENNQADRVDMDIFLRDLRNMLSEAYALEDRAISLDVQSAPVRLDVDRAVTVGLVVNEAVTNAIKHAFPGGRSGNVVIGLEQAEDTLILSVDDDGVGLQARRANDQDGVGRTLLSGLIQQLGGQHCHENRRPSGTSFRIQMSLDRPRGGQRPEPKPEDAASQS